MTRIRLAGTLIGLVLAAAGGTASAGEMPRAVIELFTSQGCSSCPPADKLIAKLAAREGVVAVSLPVDYWDYLGWKDTLGSPAHTARQKAYAATRGDGKVYTPQMVVNGLAHVVGSDAAEIEAAIAKTKGKKGALTVPVAVTESGGTIRIEIGAAPPDGPKAGGVHVYAVTRRSEVAIARGENSGRTVAYHNVVRAIVKAGDWAGDGVTFQVLRGALEGKDIDGYVVLLQTGSDAAPGVVLGAAKAPGM
jgi:hypothetical protein